MCDTTPLSSSTLSSTTTGSFFPHVVVEMGNKQSMCFSMDPILTGGTLEERCVWLLRCFFPGSAVSSGQGEGRSDKREGERQPPLRPRASPIHCRFVMFRWGVGMVVWCGSFAPVPKTSMEAIMVWHESLPETHLLVLLVVVVILFFYWGRACSKLAWSRSVAETVQVITIITVSLALKAVLISQNLHSQQMEDIFRGLLSPRTTLEKLY